MRLAHPARLAWQRLVGLGLDRQTPPPLAKRVRLNNAIAAILVGVTFPFFVGYALSQSPGPLFLATSANLVLFLLPLCLNAYGLHRLARWVQLLSLPAIVLLLCYLQGTRGRLPDAFLVMSCLPFMLLELEQRWAIALAVAIPLGLFVLVGWPGSTLFEPHVPVGQLLGGPFNRVALRVTIGLILVGITFYFRSVNERAEDQLGALVAQLQRALEQIARQQQVMIQSSRLSALGELAGGVAHEINTPLMTIQVAAAHLQRMLGRRPPDLGASAAALGRIEATVARIARMVQGLQAFAAQDEGPELRLPLRQLLGDALLLCRERSLERGTRLEVEQVPEALAVSGRRQQLAQLLLYLLENALDATDGRPERWVRVQAHRQGGLAVVEVVDSGPGIPASLRARLFQPFFTTKPVGKTPGLSLSVARGIAQAHGGNLEFDFQAPHTTVRLTLPLPPA